MSGNLESNETTRAGARKPYIAPTLKLYGDARAITKAVGSSNNKDGGSGKTQKTGV